MLKEGIGLYKGRRSDTGGYIEGYLVVLPEDAFHEQKHFICPNVLSAKYCIDSGDYTFGPFYKVDPSTVTQMGGGV